MHGPPGPFVIVGRTEKTIRTNIIAPLQQILGDHVKYWIGKGEINIYGRTIHCVSANDDRSESKIRGSTFAGAYVDEVSILPESFFKMLLSRLSIDGSKLFGTSNPDSPYHWLKRDFIDRQDALDIAIFHFTLDDNPSLSPSYKREIQREYTGLWYKRFIEGAWVLAEGSIFDFFDTDLHVLKQPPGLAKEYIIGVDYGTTNPCAFVLIGYNNMHYPNMWVEKEYYWDPSVKQRQKTDAEFADDLKDFIGPLLVNAIYIDPAAASFKVELRRKRIDNVMDANNEVLDGIRHMSTLIQQGTLKIAPQCKNLIKEIQGYVWDPKAAERGVEKPIKHADHCFCAGTMVQTDNGKIPIEHIHVGIRVFTRSGIKKVVRVGSNLKECFDYDLHGISIQCSSDHRFFTHRGWVQISSLTLHDILFKLNFECQSLALQKLESLTENRIDAIQTLLRLATGDTFLEMESICTEPYGNIITERFLKNVIYITLMETHLTMIFPICNVLLQKNILNFILQAIKEHSLLKPLKQQRSGTNQQKEESGILNMQFEVDLGDTKSSRWCADSVPNTLMVKSNDLSFVRIIARLPTGEKVELMTRSDFAQHVQHLSSATSIPKQDVAHDPVVGSSLGFQKVYNLEVDQDHEFFANDILVANSIDATRYALMHYKSDNETKLSLEQIRALKSEATYGRPNTIDDFFRIR